MVYDFGFCLKELRIAKGLSQPQVAKVLGLSKNSIYSYENNITKPSIETLKAFAVLYRVSTDYLLGLNETKNVVINMQFPRDAELLSQMFENLQKEMSKLDEKK